MITPSLSITSAQTVSPKLAIDFTSASLDLRITFTRALNTATRTNSSGYVETVNADTARFDYDPITLACKGLLIEETRTNALTYSNDLSNAAWNKATSTVAAGATTGPDNTSSASSWIPNNGVSPECLRASNVTLTADKDFTISGFFKKLGNTEAVALYSTAGGNGFILNVNLTNGSIISALAVGTGTYRSSGVIAYPNGWYRIWISGRHAVGNTTGQFRFRNVNASGSNVTGNGTDGLYVWGCQMEQSTVDISFPTSVIPTTSSSLTRNADVATMTGTNFSNWYNAAKGTFRVDAISIATGTRPIISADDNSANNSLLIKTEGTAPTFVATQSGSQQASVVAGTITANTDMYAYTSYDTNYFGIAQSALRQVTASGTVPTVDRLRIGASQAGAYLNSVIKKLQFWP